MKKVQAGFALLIVLAALFIAYQNLAPAATQPAAPGVPSSQQLAQFKQEKGLRATDAELKKMRVASVVRVVDGDTVELKIGSKTEKARLLGVNTPETVDPRRPVQTYGKEASDFTKSTLAAGSKVFVRFDVEERDKYGRLLVHLYLQDGTWFNALLIRAGFAQLMTYSPNVSHAAYFKELQRKAREEEVGLWRLPEYRAKK